MMFRRRERGEGQGGCIVGLILLLAAVFVAYKLIPVKVKAADLRQTVMDEAKSGSSTNDDKIKYLIMDKAKQLGLPLQERDIHITRGGGQIRIEVQYTVPVEFPGYVYNWKFEHTAENPLF